MKYPRIHLEKKMHGNNIGSTFFSRLRSISLAGLILFAPVISMAQDDLYFVPTKDNRTKERKSREDIQERKWQAMSTEDYSGINKSDDEYNRRQTSRSNVPYTVADSVVASNDSIASDVIRFSVGTEGHTDVRKADTVYKYVVLNEDDYRYSRCMSRFDDFFWWNRVYSPSLFYSRSLAWYAGWYDPWFSPWYDPWFDPWYYGWYSPWYSNMFYADIYWHRYDYWHYPPVWYYSYNGGIHNGISRRDTPFKGYSTHSHRNLTAARENTNHRIARRNGDGVNAHTGMGYRSNGHRNYINRNSNNINYNSSHTWNNSQPSHPSYNSGTSHGFRGGGHTGTIGGGRSGGGTFGGGRRR